MRGISDQKIRQSDNEMIGSGVIVLSIASIAWGHSAFAPYAAPTSVPDSTYHSMLHFEFTHSLRIPNYHVTVDLNDLNPLSFDSVDVHATSAPMPGHGWQETAVDTSFRISRDRFDRLVKAVNAIHVPKLELSNSFTIGNDGYRCVIKYGDLQNSVAIEIWSPSGKTGPAGYYAACRQFLEIGGFDPHEIFDR